MWVARRTCGAIGSRTKHVFKPTTRAFSALSSLQTIELSGRQEGVLLERFPAEYSQTDLQACLANHDVHVNQDDVLLMRSRLGKSTGRAVVLTKHAVKDAEGVFPGGTTIRPLDEHDVGLFVEHLV